MRVINFNIKGANVPGRKDHATQERSWHLLASYNADIALLQEVEAKANPDWVRKRWTIIQGDQDIYGKPLAGWGSVIAAQPNLNLKVLTNLKENYNLRLLYDYAIFCEIDLPDGSKALVSSIHAPAVRLQQYLEQMGYPAALTTEEMKAMGQVGETPWALDLFFAEIKALV